MCPSIHLSINSIYLSIYLGPNSEVRAGGHPVLDGEGRERDQRLGVRRGGAQHHQRRHKTLALPG